MSHITTEQNTENSKDLLCAQRQSYDNSKHVFFLRVWLSLSLAILGPILLTLFPNLSHPLSLIAIFYLVFDFFWLRRIEYQMREDGAKIQELFDTRLFKLPWNDIVCGNSPDSELVYERSSAYRTKHEDLSNLHNWYPTELSELEHDAARLVCQRINVWWDVSLREKLFWIVVGVVVFSVFILIAIFNAEVSILLSAVVLVLPFFEVAIGYARDQYTTIKNTKRTKELIESRIDSKNFSDNEARNIQDCIFRHRSTCPFVPNWFYNFLRSAQESEMNYGAAHYIARIRSAGESSH